MAKHTNSDDPNIFAKNIVSELIAKYDPQAIVEEEADSGKNPAAVILGRMGGSKGGQARAAALTSKQKIAIARKAARARWGKKK
jgi:hypothetical protein